MTLSQFPVLPGQGWSVKKTPSFSTKVATHVSGREVRAAKFAHGLYNFELMFDGLDSSGSNSRLTNNSLQTLMGFYAACQGQFSTFLYVDPTDYTVTTSQFGLGDGSTTVFYLSRPIGGSYEPVYVNTVSNISVNGVATSSYTLTAPNTVTFATAPAMSAVLTWSGTFGFQCRFADDTLEFENFQSGYWKTGGIKFRQVR